MVEIVAAELSTVFSGKVINVIDLEGKLIIETETDYFALSDAEEKLMRVLRNTVQAYEGLLEMQRQKTQAETSHQQEQIIVLAAENNRLTNEARMKANPALARVMRSGEKKPGAKSGSQPVKTRDLYSDVNHDGTPARTKDGRRLYKSHEESRKLDALEAKANAALKARAKKRAKK